MDALLAGGRMTVGERAGDPRRGPRPARGGLGDGGRGAGPGGAGPRPGRRAAAGRRRPRAARRPGRRGAGPGTPVLGPGAVDWRRSTWWCGRPGSAGTARSCVAAEAAGVRVTTAMALWLEDHADAPVLAVTGTKGKSTTAALAAAVLEADGRRGGAHRQHRGPGARHLRPAPARRLRGRGLLVPGGRRDPVARGGGPDQPGPRPPRLARRGRALLPRQAPPRRGRPARVAWPSAPATPRPWPAPPGHPDRTLYGPEGRVRGGRRRLARGRRRPTGRHRPAAGAGPPQRLEPVRCGGRGAAGDRARPRRPTPWPRAVDGLRTGCPSRCRAGRRARRPHLRGRRPRLQPVRLGRVHRDVRRAAR